MNRLIQNGHIIVDKLVTAKHTIVGEDVARSILKATTDEVTLPKKKYVDYLMLCTKDQNVSVPEMSKLILDRAHNSSWVVSIKALLIVHEIMNYGNERFFQYMASDSQSLNLDTFSDIKDTLSLVMSKHVRSYANYVNVKAVSFRVVGYDFCKVKRGGKEAFFKTLDVKKLFKNLTQLHTQLDCILAFRPDLNELLNSLVVHVFGMVFKDLVRLVACLNDATANLLEHFGTFDRKDCQQALSLYKNFPNYLKKIAKFYKTAEHLGFESSQMPGLDQVPANLQSQMEEHIRGMENNSKTSSTFTLLPKPESKQSVQRRLSMPASSFTSALTSPEVATAPVLKAKMSAKHLSSPFGSNFSDLLSAVSHKEQEMIMQEEERILQMFKKQKEEADKAKGIPTTNPTTPLNANINNNSNSAISNNKSPSNNNNENTANNNGTNNTSNNNSSGFDDFFATLDISSAASSNNTPAKQTSAAPVLSSLSLPPPGFKEGTDLLEPTRLNSSIAVPTSPTSPPTPCFLDFSKVSLPPFNYVPPNYMAQSYNMAAPVPSQIPPTSLYNTADPYNNQMGLIRQQLHLEQQKQHLQHQQNHFFH